MKHSNLNYSVTYNCGNQSSKGNAYLMVIGL